MILCPKCDEPDVEFVTNRDQPDGTSLADCVCGQCHTRWTQHYEVEFIPLAVTNVTASMFGGSDG